MLFCIEASEMVLPHGFVKKTQKTPAGRTGFGTETPEGDQMSGKTRKGRIAKDETIDDFLNEQGILAETEELAIKELIAEQIRSAMAHEGVTKTVIAQRMRTSRRQLDRLLDPANTSVTLATLRRAAQAVGRKLKVELV